MKKYENVPNKKYVVNENYFSQIDSENKAYWLGFLYADGYVRMHKNRSGEIKLKLSIKDSEHLNNFRSHLSSTHKIKEYTSKVVKHGKISLSNCVSLSIYSTKMVQDLFALGCINNKTFKTEFPKSSILKEHERHFIRGLFDGDGCIYHSIGGNINCYILGTTEILSSISDILSYNGILSSVKKCGNIYRLNINGGKNGLLMFKRFLYDNSNILLNRKKYIFDSINYFDRRRIQKIKNIQKII